jgi:hypothetical protein
VANGRWTFIAALSVLASGVHAQADLAPWEKGSLQIGGFVSTIHSELRLDSAQGLGANVDLENGIGLDSAFSTYRIDGVYRFGSTRRHQIEVHYYVSDRDGSRTLEDSLEVGDVVFPAGTGVTSELDLWFLNLDYSYAFLQDDRVRIGGSLGLHTTGIDFQIATIDGTRTEQERLTAPLPVVGLRGEVILARPWRLKGSIDLFYLEYDRYEGSLVDTSLALEYLPFKNVGFGLGLNIVRYGVKAEETSDVIDFNGKVQLDFVGALVYVKLFF